MLTNFEIFGIEILEIKLWKKKKTYLKRLNT